MRITSKVLASTILATTLGLGSFGLAVPVCAAETGDGSLAPMEETADGELVAELDAFGGDVSFEEAAPQSSDSEKDVEGVSEQDLLNSEESATTESSIPTYTLLEGEAQAHYGQLVRYNFSISRSDRYTFMVRLYRSDTSCNHYGGLITIYKKNGTASTQIYQGGILDNFENYKYTRLNLEPGEYYMDAYWWSTHSGKYANFAVIFQGDNYGKNNSGSSNSGSTNSGSSNSGSSNSGSTVTRVTMTRLYNKWSGEHLYTSNANEVKKLVSLGWKNEGTAWIAPSTSATPVYRLYNKWSGCHHYTASKEEYEKCASVGWTKEGIAWYSADASTGVPIYRGFNRYVHVGTHHYTTNWSEMQTMVKNGWRYEGIGWYGLK